jgi:hypothetical protein
MNAYVFPYFSSKYREIKHLCQIKRAVTKIELPGGLFNLTFLDAIVIYVTTQVDRLNQASLPATPRQGAEDC